MLKSNGIKAQQIKVVSDGGVRFFEVYQQVIKQKTVPVNDSAWTETVRGCLGDMNLSE